MNIRSMYRVRTRQCQRGVPIYLPFQAHKVNKQQARSQDISQGVGVQTAGPQPGYFLGGQGANSRPVARIFPRGRGANSRTVVRIFPRGPGCKQQARSQDISQGAGVQTAGPQPGYFLGGRGANSRTVAWIFPRGPGCKQQARGQDIPQEARGPGCKQQDSSLDISQGAGVQTAGPWPGYSLGGCKEGCCSMGPGSPSETQ